MIIIVAWLDMWRRLSRASEDLTIFKRDFGRHLALKKENNTATAAVWLQPVQCFEISNESNEDWCPLPNAKNIVLQILTKYIFTFPLADSNKDTWL